MIETFRQCFICSSIITSQETELVVGQDIQVGQEGQKMSISVFIPLVRERDFHRRIWRHFAAIWQAIYASVAKLSECELSGHLDRPNASLFDGWKVVFSYNAPRPAFNYLHRR
jgi:hypothetical protein